MIPVSRREALRSGTVVVALAVVGCGKKEPPTCSDTAGMSPEDIKARETLAYQDRGPDPNKQCAKCVQFVEGPSATVCASCKVVKGPISPAGTCKVFAPKT
jgi:hypothetical protein